MLPMLIANIVQVSGISLQQRTGQGTQFLYQGAQFQLQGAVYVKSNICSIEYFEIYNKIYMFMQISEISNCMYFLKFSVNVRTVNVLLNVLTLI